MDAFGDNRGEARTTPARRECSTGVHVLRPVSVGVLDETSKLCPLGMRRCRAMDHRGNEGRDHTIALVSLPDQECLKGLK